MPQLSVAQLLSTLSPTQALSKLYTIADTVGLTTTAWQKLSPLRSLFSVVSQFFSGLTTVQATVNAGGFLDTATGDLLARRALLVYGVTPNPASFASNPVTIDNSGGGQYNFAPGDLLVRNSAPNGQAYANLEEITILPGSTGNIVQVQCVVAGSIGNANIGDINAFVSASPSLTVTNPSAFVGLDAETDPEIRVRCTESLGALSPMGPALAYQYVAKSQLLNGGVDISRAILLPARGDGVVRVVVASPSGVVNGTTTDPTSDLGKVFLALSTQVVPSGYTLLLSSATARSVPVNATIYVSTSSGLSSADAVTAAITAITSYIESVPIGGINLTGSGGAVLWRSLEGVYASSAPGVLEAQLVLEANVSMGPTDVAVLTGTPSISIVQVSA